VDESWFELGRRTGTLPPPPWVVWESLTEPRRAKVRQWLDLRADEVDPRIIESVRPTLVTWSSIWPYTPDHVIRFEIAGDGGPGTLLTWTWAAPTDVDDPAILGRRRYRLNQLIWGELRYSYA
jgi:hypothetical protein